jgi:hypothetical protein
MIVDIFSTLQNLTNRNYNFKVLTESLSGGEVIKQYSDPITIQCTVLPLTGNDLRNTPEGQYTTADRVILTSISSLKIGDILIENIIEYEIRSEINLGELINLKKYVAKKL